MCSSISGEREKKTITAGCKVGKKFDYVQKASFYSVMSTIISFKQDSFKAIPIHILIAQRAANLTAIKVKGKKTCNSRGRLAQDLYVKWPADMQPL